MSKKMWMTAGFALFAAASASFGAATVGVLNPLQAEGTGFGQVQNSPTGALNASFIPFATFKTQVATAFANNAGGVLDFEQTPNGSFPAGTFGAPGTPLSVTYGVSQTNSIGIDRTSAVAGDVLDAGVGNTVFASGTSYLGFSGTTTPGLRLTPIGVPAGFGVTSVGFTILERGALRTPTVSFQLDNGTIVPFATDAIANAAPSNFYGYQAPAGRSISIINYSDAAAGALRIDDLGFIVSAVPEPATLGMLAASGVTLLIRRRRA